MSLGESFREETSSTLEKENTIMTNTLVNEVYTCMLISNVGKSERDCVDKMTGRSRYLPS